VAGLGATDGGYFPGDWGLATLALLLVVATAVLVADLPRPGRLELLFLGGLGSLAVWAALSTLWSPGATAPVLEAERALLYVSAAGAAIALLSFRGSAAALLAGVVAGAVAVSTYALATRLFPGRVGGAYDPSSGYQLAEPVGYWNTLGLLAGIGILLALGFAAHSERLPARVLAAGCLVVLLPTLYFTFSRGALAALVVGAAAQFAFDPRRARLLASGLVVSLPALVGVLLASRYHALTSSGGSLATAQREGRELAWALAVLAVAAGAAAAGVHVAARRVRLPARAASLLVAAAVAVAACVAVGVLAAAGGPADAADRISDSFGEPPPAGNADLQRRLLSASGNGRGDYWHVAWTMVRDEPLLGEGAGSFETAWFRERSVAFHARDAHNLYLETLAELGPVGLLLLLGTFALPFLALGAARRRPYAAAAAAALFAYLAHAAVDWDWEMPTVTIAAIVCAATLLASTRPEEPAWLTGRRRWIALAALAPVAAAALVMHVGNRAAAASIAATEAGNPAQGLAEAHRAASWAPWSEEGWQLRGEAELALDRNSAARRSLLRALERNPDSWSVWLDLALATSGDARDRALDRAAQLNPLGPEVRDLRTKP
jgi:O-antigen ligase